MHNLDGVTEVKLAKSAKRDEAELQHRAVPPRPGPPPAPATPDQEDCVGSSRVTKFEISWCFGGVAARPTAAVAAGGVPRLVGGSDCRGNRRCGAGPARPRPPPEVDSDRARPLRDHGGRLSSACSEPSGSSACRQSATRLAKLDKDIAAAQQSLQTAEQEKAQFAQAQLQFPALYATVGRLGKAVPADEDVPSLLVQLNHAAGTVGRRLPLDRAEARLRPERGRRRPRRRRRQRAQARRAPARIRRAAAPVRRHPHPRAPPEPAGRRPPPRPAPPRRRRGQRRPSASAVRRRSQPLPFEYKFKGNFFNLKKVIAQRSRDLVETRNRAGRGLRPPDHDRGLHAQERQGDGPGHQLHAARRPEPVRGRRRAAARRASIPTHRSPPRPPRAPAAPTAAVTAP